MRSIIMREMNCDPEEEYLLTDLDWILGMLLILEHQRRRRTHLPPLWLGTPVKRRVKTILMILTQIPVDFQRLWGKSLYAD